MILGVTGSREAPTDAQRTAFSHLWMQRLRPTEVHHGDCLGFDFWVHTFATVVPSRPKIVVHPPLSNALRAFCEGTVLPAKEYGHRNRDIVAACEVLVAAPKDEETRSTRSGTWMTVRVARLAGKRHFVIYRDGAVVEWANGNIVSSKGRSL